MLDLQDFRNPSFSLMELITDALQLEQVVIDRYKVKVR